MKKLFTLLMMLSCILVVNAQVTESGNGFKETFDYDPGMDFNDLLIDGVSEIVKGSAIKFDGFSSYINGWLGEMDPSNDEYAEGVIIDGMLKITLQPQQEGSVGWGFTTPLDMSDNSTLTFKYIFPEGTSWYFGAEDAAEGWFETDDASSFVFGTDELQEVTIDFTTLTGEGEIDMTQIAGVWILPTNGGDAAGELYFDDIAIGDAVVSTGINKVSVRNNFKIYPNPARTQFKIDTDAASISIINTIGQEVYSKANYVKGTSIDVKELKSGIYLFKADNSSKKLIIR